LIKDSSGNWISGTSIIEIIAYEGSTPVKLDADNFEVVYPTDWDCDCAFDE
jgi:hypothetical protein